MEQKQQRWVVQLLCAVWIIFGSFPVLALPNLQNQESNTTNTSKGADAVSGKVPSVRDSIKRCQGLKHDNLLAELRKVTQESFVGAKVHFRQMVGDHWTRHKVKTLLDMQVDTAAAQMYGQLGYWTRIKSTFSKGTAKKMAEEMARKAFLGEAFGRRLEMLSGDISKDLHRLMQLRVQMSIHRSMECVNHFLQSQYHRSMRVLFQSHVRELLRQVRPDVKVKGTTPSLVHQHRKALMGVGLVVAGGLMRVMMRRLGQRIAKRMAKRLTLRVASRLGTKLIPWVGWGLLAWDAWELARARG
ncbi:MAG: hypothetical protein AAGJ35_13905, partial [Myxococcota bacterium]